MLDSFYCICSVAIKGFVTQTTARKIISCLPMSPSSAKLKLYCEPGAESLFKDAVQQNSKRPTAVKINELQRPNVLVPQPLKDYNLASSQYTKLTSDSLEELELSDEFNLEELNTVATKLSSYLIEAIIQFDEQWVFITEYEMYIRNRSQVDDCAQESWWLMYPGELEAYLVKKNEKGNTWFEISLFYDRIEFLVTGGLRGSYSGGNVIPFLGSAQKFMDPLSIRTNTRTTNILVREEGAAITRTTRRLRQYKKMAANKKWLFHSSRFVRKGFFMTVPLEVHLNFVKINMTSVASYLLAKIVEKISEKADAEYTLKLLVDRNIFNRDKQDRSLTTFKKDCPQINLTANQQSIVKCFIYLAEGKMNELTADDILSVYKGTLASFCKNEDEKKLLLFIAPQIQLSNDTDDYIEGLL
ncbi:hypothetical protein MFLAVUS_010005 [Mucor flavus]|uniref:Uncharacterized protein n=1 Tax=Mucor flavus TaxID=439312 RepID=A0ABP9ZBG4_9FUNG